MVGNAFGRNSAFRLIARGLAASISSVLICLSAAGCDRKQPDADSTAPAAVATRPAPPVTKPTSFTTPSPADLKPGDVWLAACSGQVPDGRGDELLAKLFAAAGKTDPFAQGSVAPFRVLFVHAGEKFGNQWLTIACAGPNGMTAVVFDRQDGSMLNQRVVLGMAWEYRWKKLKWELLKIERNGFEIRTTLDVNGGINEVLWNLDPAIGPPPRTPDEPRIESPLLACRATPLTGWFGFQQGLRGQGDPGNRDEIVSTEPEPWRALTAMTPAWQPNVGKVLYLQGPPARQELQLALGTHEIGFNAEGQLVASPSPSLAIGGSKNFTVTEKRILKVEVYNSPAQRVVGTFDSIQGLHQSSVSPDGRWLVLKGQQGLKIYDLTTTEMLLDHDGDSDLHTARSPIRWNKDGTRGAAAGSRCVYVWSLVKPYWFARFPHGRRGAYPDVALTPDGKQLAASAAESAKAAYWPDIDAVLAESSRVSGSVSGSK